MQRTSTEIPKFLTILEASYKANVSYGTVRNWIKKYGLKNFKIGKNIRIKESDLYEFLESYTTRGYLK
ncbi:helix-turn-helix domain-containing protein [Companilactobacillus mishanensis]|uniref:Helix-turn-helix domain-containing protein n=1 Tax=Companilactobacillus mishanensis TaxID=2486008 RepID=A0A5P0ZEZ5_9LACO|nr:helix-turn-helix domain-containing protein [Companilactobacillus mishanensis]MQS44277.1 helix-turn-helix domain-containing protein [Companilactobacillus mishanensis]MQS51620.1 helix-turn-helix domain-containing protein [Companilactobacillus mishanensis]